MRPSSFRIGFLSQKWMVLDSRAVAYVEGGACRLISRNRNTFKTFEPFAQPLPGNSLAGSAILDGEIVHPGPDGRPMFYELMRRGPFCFMLSICSGWIAGICGTGRCSSESRSFGS
jgi:hypothetical protein